MKRTLATTVFFLSFLFINWTNISLSDDITIISINKDTVEQIGPYPFTRDKYASFIESIFTDYSPKCVYLNLLIYQYQQDSMKSDTSLFKAVNDKQNIFFSAMVSDTAVEHSYYIKSQFNEINYTKTWKVGGAIFPLKDIVQSGAYTSISDVGINNRGIVKRMPTVVQINNINYLSTPLFLTVTYLGVKPEDLFSGNSFGLDNKKVKTDKNGWFEIDFNHTFDKFSYHDIVNKKVNREFIDQKVILFGIEYPELEDYLPIDRYKVISGVELIANATQTLIDQLR
ncbi:MAG: CHASE2 domain-containing protein [Spirochaetota bacterium]|nr:MAG: CHASE2 domain-containing protein [Spirochaetota bacterium]